MAARLTIGREHYSGCEDRMRHVRDRAVVLGRQLMTLVDEDAQAYRAVVRGRALPKTTATAGAERTAAIQSELRHAAEVPEAVAGACAELIALGLPCAELGNRNAATDATVAALLAQAAMRGAALNACTNLDRIRDDSFAAKMEMRLRRTTAAGEAALARALDAARPGV
jgi:formiminotetrahydrofolate cyclodeaminase